MPDLFARLRPFLLAAALIGLAAGGVLWWQELALAAGRAWAAGTAVVQGALLQEAIDVAVILNALRVLRAARPAPVPEAKRA